MTVIAASIADVLKAQLYATPIQWSAVEPAYKVPENILRRHRQPKNPTVGSPVYVPRGFGG